MSRVLNQEQTTQLVTDLTYLGAGPAAIGDLQRRLDTLTGTEDRIVVGDIDTDSEGRPTCGITFNCDSYDPPVEGRPDPRALEDLRKVLAGVNLDGCLFWNPIALLLADD